MRAEYGRVIPLFFFSCGVLSKMNHGGEGYFFSMLSRGW